MGEPNAEHTPVMVNECLDLLAPALQGPAPLMVDATVGLGGHTHAALLRFPDLHVVGIDRDRKALEKATRRLSIFGERFTPFHGTYNEISHAAKGQKVDGILMDLGVSSMQLDDLDRGFSYSKNAALDMRMDTDRPYTAALLVEQADERELARIISRFGEERFARRIAKAIVTRRQDKPLETTSELARLIEETIPAPARRKGGNPSKRTFQALRIAVNEELDILKEALPDALSALRVGGRIVVESYHSLEDRLVKRTFASGATPNLPHDLPVSASQVHEATKLRLLTRGALKPSPEEIESNPRSRSARLRAAELIAPWRRYDE